MADDKRLKLFFERDPEIPHYLRAGEVKLRQALANLMCIALETTSQGSWLLQTDTAIPSTQALAGLRFSLTLKNNSPGSPRIPRGQKRRSRINDLSRFNLVWSHSWYSLAPASIPSNVSPSE